MGKNDFLAPKAIANRMKSKGLQKLRWFCQMCQKQCRDENGFKCHLSSESHKRQMEVFGQNPERVIQGFSEEFESDFMEHLRRAHPFSRVSATVLYNEFIADKYHIHMNSTKWYTLTEFVKYLGRSGQCKVDETPKGWFLALIQRDPAEELSEKKRAKRERADEEEEERLQREIAAQAERAHQAQGAQAEGGPPVAAGSELRRDDDTQPVKITLSSAARVAAERSLRDASQAQGREANTVEGFGEDEGPGGAGQPSSKRSKVEQVMAAEVASRARAAASAGASASGRERVPERVDHWLAEGVVVKILSKELKELGYYKKKGVVVRVLHKYIGEVSLLDSGDVVRIDQAQLETVLPQPGGAVLVLNGRYRGCPAVLLGVDTAKFQAQVQVTGGPHAGQQLSLDYEDVSKLIPKPH